MKILVTGVAGFLGSNLADFLIQNDHHVVGIDNFNTYYSPKVKHYNLRSLIEQPKFRLYQNDILDIPNLDKIFDDERPDAVIHLAAWAGVTYSIEHPAETVRNNIEGTVNLLELCKKYSVNNVIFASTSSIYGNSPTPFEESMITDQPLAPYPASKKACELMLYTYAKNYNINVSILRIFNPLGLKMRPDLALPMLIRACEYEDKEFPMYWTWEEAEQIGRDYCYVEHIFQAVLTILTKPLQYEIFNVGNSSPVTLRALINTVEEVCGKEAKIKLMPKRQGEMSMTYANISKAQDLLNYNPNTSIKSMVQIYYTWFMKQETWYKHGDF